MIIFLVIPGCYSPVSEIIPVDNLTSFEKKATGNTIADNNSDDEGNSDGNGSVESGETTSDPVTLEVIYEHGTTTSSKNIYVIWIENTGVAFIQNIFICNRARGNTLADIALPFWRINKLLSFTTEELDAVTGATIKNSDFTKSAILADTSIRKFSIYMEIARSFDSNDWFTDQPALLYSADVDLDASVTEYEMTLYGWTPNSTNPWTANAVSSLIIPVQSVGSLQKELKFITNKINDTKNGFGDPDTTNRATNMVKKITVKIIK